MHECHRNATFGWEIVENSPYTSYRDKKKEKSLYKVKLTLFMSFYRLKDTKQTPKMAQEANKKGRKA